MLIRYPNWVWIKKRYRRRRKKRSYFLPISTVFSAIAIKKEDKRSVGVPGPGDIEIRWWRMRVKEKRR